MNGLPKESTHIGIHHLQVVPGSESSALQVQKCQNKTLFLVVASCFFQLVYLAWLALRCKCKYKNVTMPNEDEMSRDLHGGGGSLCSVLFAQLTRFFVHLQVVGQLQDPQERVFLGPTAMPRIGVLLIDFQPSLESWRQVVAAPILPRLKDRPAAAPPLPAKHKNQRAAN